MPADDTRGESSVRSAITAILDAVSRDPDLHENYVLKGGLALQLVFGSPRRSDDLDFNALQPTSNQITGDTRRHLLTFAERLNHALAATAEAYDFTRIATIRQRVSEEIPTLLTDVAFETYSGGKGHVKLQLTLSEIVCETIVQTVDGIDVHAASLEDIIAEKLKALLQQISRETVRSSDVFDIWYFTTAYARDIDPAVVSRYLLEKKKQWHSMPDLTKDQFRRKSVVEHSVQDYESLARQLPPTFDLVPFRTAYECVLRFVDRLELPR